MINPRDSEDTFQNSDLERFAEYMGLKGCDADLFYEMYFDLDNKDYESEMVLEEIYE